MSEEEICQNIYFYVRNLCKVISSRKPCNAILSLIKNIYVLKNGRKQGVMEMKQKKRFKLFMIFAMILAFIWPATAFASSKKDETFDYIAYGDSIAYGVGSMTTSTSYVNLYSKLLSANEVVELQNLAIPGLTTSGLLQQLNSIRMENADLVTVSVGGNNVLKCKTSTGIDPLCAITGVQQFQKDWPQIIAKIRALNPDAYIQVMNVYNPFAMNDPLYA
jgi:lysophospholipase L1-like esterase